MDRAEGQQLRAAACRALSLRPGSDCRSRRPSLARHGRHHGTSPLGLALSGHDDVCAHRRRPVAGRELDLHEPPAATPPGSAANSTAGSKAMRSSRPTDGSSTSCASTAPGRPSGGSRCRRGRPIDPLQPGRGMDRLPRRCEEIHHPLRRGVEAVLVASRLRPAQTSRSPGRQRAQHPCPDEFCRLAQVEGQLHSPLPSRREPARLPVPRLAVRRSGHHRRSSHCLRRRPWRRPQRPRCELPHLPPLPRLPPPHARRFRGQSARTLEWPESRT